jgi:hypothetical protein
MTHIKTAGLFQFEGETKYSPISLEYFLDMELAMGGEGKLIMKDGGKLKTIREIVEYFSLQENRAKVEAQLKPENWQYYNCMLAEFRHNVADHHALGWENMTKEYYESLDLMTDEEIEQFLKEVPIEFHNGFVKHSYHRACSMIGRLINGKPYIPFYMETNQIYKDPTKHDGIHRMKPLTSRVKLLEQLDAMGIDRDEYCLTQSSILSLMGLRPNDDLDIIISSDLRSQNIKFPPGIDVFPPNISKFNYFGAKNDDDILENYCIGINGYKFLEPRFYFARKNINETPKDIRDWELIREFFAKGNHKGYPFNFDSYKWGLIPTWNKIQLKDINTSKYKIVIDKYDRILDEGAGPCNLGRVVYHDIRNERFIKIFHPGYCRLENLKEALESGVLNGLCPALTDLIYDNDQLIGYICKEGIPLAEHAYEMDKLPKDFFITVLRNCERRQKIFYDLVPINVIKLSNGQCSLIDLESVYNIDKNLSNNLAKDVATIKPNNLLKLIKNI